mgnify:CR=1 FL=1|jgi:hypothetical protein
MIHKNDFSKIETSFDTRYNYNGKNFNIYIKYNNKDTSIASININNTFNTPGYTTIWKKNYNGNLTDDMVDYIISQVNKELKTNIIPMYDSMIEDMKKIIK